MTAAAFPAIDLDANLPAIRTDVPIHIHPSALHGTKILNLEGTLGASALGTARVALMAVHESYAKIEDVQKELVKQAKPVGRMQNTNRGDTVRRHGSDYTDDENVRMVNGVPTLAINHADFLAAAKAELDRTSPKVDAKVKELQGVHNILSNQVAAALEDTSRKTPEGISNSAEVRNYVRGLSEKVRFGFVMDAIEADDKITVASILHAQPFLSGLTPKQVELLRANAAEKWAPQQHAQAKAIATLIDQVSTAGSLLLGRFAKVQAMQETPAAILDKKLKALATGK